MANNRVLILGGGIAGLSAAHYIKKLRPTAAIKILESQSTPGGWVKTFKHERTKTLVELGPRTLKMDAAPPGLNLRMLLVELGLGKQLLPMDSFGKVPLTWRDEKVQLLFTKEDKKRILDRGVSGFMETYKIFQDIQELAEKRQKDDKFSKSISELTYLEFLEEKLPGLQKNQEYMDHAKQAVSCMCRGIFGGDASKISPDFMFNEMTDLVPGKDYRRETGKRVGNEMIVDMITRVSTTDGGKSVFDFKNAAQVSMKMTSKGAAAGKDFNAVKEELLEEMQDVVIPMKLLDARTTEIVQFQGGLQTLVTSLRRSLERLDTELTVDKRVTNIIDNGEHFLVETHDGDQYETDFVISALPSATLSRIIIPNECNNLSTMGRVLSKIQVLPIATVTLGWSNENVKLPEQCKGAFGHLCPGKHGVRVNSKDSIPNEVLGIIYDSNIRKNEDQKVFGDEICTKVTVMLGGMNWSDSSLGGSPLGYNGAVAEGSQFYAKCSEMAMNACEKQLGYLFKD